jgi:HTH-type transcriptional regulator / antitoxin HigA
MKEGELTTARASSYSTLLAKIQPQVVHDEALNERFIAILHDLDARWDSLSTEERKLHELLVLIIQDFEKRTYKIRAATPIEILEELMAANDLKSKDLVGVFATESVVSEVLSGKRSLNVEHIKRLSERFNVSPAIFFP